MKYDDFIRYFDVRSKHSNGCQAICPCHSDKTASLSISRGRVHPIVMRCFAGCSNEDILSAVGLKVSDMFEEKPQKTWRDFLEWDGRKIEKVYNYYSFYSDDYGYSRIRFVGTKRMTIGRFVGAVEDSNIDVTITKNGSIASQFPFALYGNLQLVKQAIAKNKYVFVTEGEKDTDTLTRLGYPSCTYGSSDSWYKELAECFRDARLIVLADNDDVGRKVAKRIRTDVKGLAMECYVVVPMPDMMHGDITDFFDAGHTKNDFERMIREHINEQRT